MTIPKQQHWVPRFYLRFFSTVETIDGSHPKVWLFSKNETDTEGEPILTNIKNVANSRYLYSPEDQNGHRSDELERRLADHESLLGSIWPELATDFLAFHRGTSIRGALALFVSLLFLRHPRRQAETESLHDQLVKFVDAIPKDKNGNPMIAKIEYPKVVSHFDSSGWQDFKAVRTEEAFAASIAKMQYVLQNFLCRSVGPSFFRTGQFS